MKIYSIIIILYCIGFYLCEYYKEKKKVNLIKILCLLPILIEVVR